MLKFTVRRLLQLIPILLGLSILVFFWMQNLPGGPAEALLGERANPEAVAEIRRIYGLDRPLHEQYLSWLGRAVRLDFGQSIQSRRPITTEIRERFPATVELALAAMVFAVGLGIPLGFLAAKRAHTWLDTASLVGSLLGVSIPVFVLAILLKYVFGVKLGWFPTIGREDVTATYEHPTGFYLLDAIITGNPRAFVDSLRHLFLPAIALGTIPLAFITRMTRAAVLEVVGEDYVRTAEAKGMTAAVVDRRHILRNAMLPVSTVLGWQVGLLLAGAVLTETVFAWPGIGRWLAEAVLTRDFPVVQGGVLFVAVVFVLVNLLVDITYMLLNPRIRVGG